MKLVLIAINIFLITQIFAQNTSNDVLFTIDNENVNKDEFIRYSKINGNNLSNIDINSLELLVDKYIAYKLKILEAKKSGYNNSKEYKTKIYLYKKQLLWIYLADVSTINKLVDEAYNRLLVEIRVKHILVKLSPYSSKKDSVIAYKKAINIKKRIVNGENFNSVALETSDDPTTAVNGGDLWYITAFDLPYNLENYLYKAKSNSFIGPLKTKLGYHLIKIGNRRTNIGNFKVAQILLNRIKNDTLKLVKSKIDSIYKLVKSKNNFYELAAKYSEDKSTSMKNGIIPWFSTNQMPHEFENATYNLKRNGDISKPVETKDAWHIIKRIDKKEIPPLEKIREQVEQEVIKSDRYNICKNKILKKARKRHKIKEYYSIYEVKSEIDSTIFDGRWKIPDSIPFNKTLFSINNKKYLQTDFVNYLYKSQKPVHATSTDSYVNKKYKEYLNNELLKFEERELIENNNNFKNNIREYSELVLFNYYENNIAKQNDNFDTLNLKKHYTLHTDRYNKNLYANMQFLQYDISTKDEDLEKYLIKYSKKGYLDNELVEKLEKALKTQIKLTKYKEYIENQNKYADIVFEKFRQKKINNQTKYVFLDDENIVVCIKSKIKNYTIPFEILKQQIIIDYKKEIERKNINKLKIKYSVNINKTVLKSLENLL